MKTLKSEAMAKVSERCFNYHREHIQDYANLTKDLYRLTDHKAVFDWQEHHYSAFGLMKEKLFTTPIFSYPKVKDVFLLETDTWGQNGEVFTSMAPSHRSHIITS